MHARERPAATERLTARETQKEEREAEDICCVKRYTTADEAKSGQGGDKDMQEGRERKIGKETAIEKDSPAGMALW